MLLWVPFLLRALSAVQPRVRVQPQAQLCCDFFQMIQNFQDESCFVLDTMKGA